MADPAPGRFITLEGGEGTGKSTLLAALRERFAAIGIDCVLTREPGGTPRAEAIRALVLTKDAGESFSPLAQALLVSAARSDHLDAVIRPALAAGQWVVSDRFSDSTRVYQGVCGEVPANVIAALEQSVVGPTRPDLTLLLDAPVDVALLRRHGRGGTSDVFEARDHAFHEQVRNAFLSIARSEPERCAILDAAGPPDKIADAAWNVVQHRLLSKAPPS